jgi:hypothetical protein
VNDGDFALFAYVSTINGCKHYRITFDSKLNKKMLLTKELYGGWHPLFTASIIKRDTLVFDAQV